MDRKILVGYDDSDQAKDALALGEQLRNATGAQLIVAGVFQFDPMWKGFDSHFHDAEVEYARQIEAAAAAVGAEAEAFPSRSAARGLHELAEEIEADLILVGSARHGRVGQAIAGSTGCRFFMDRRVRLESPRWAIATRRAPASERSWSPSTGPPSPATR